MAQLIVDIGPVAPRTNKTIYFNVISLVEGTVELSQLVRYKTGNTQRSQRIDANQSQKNDETSSKQIQSKAYNHNVSIDYFDDSVIKSKKETIVIPCTAEFIFTGKFYSLNKEALTKIYKQEDFLFRIELEIKSVDIDILDMFLISVSHSKLSFIENLNLMSFLNPIFRIIT